MRARFLVIDLLVTVAKQLYVVCQLVVLLYNKLVGISDIHFIERYTIIFIFFIRTFTEPHLPERVVLDAVSSLTTAIKHSLRLGTIRNSKFNVNFRRDVFKYLFNNCGSSVRHRQGKLYSRSDFNHFFVMTILCFVTG